MHPPIKNVNTEVCTELNELQSIELCRPTGVSTFMPTHMAFAPDVQSAGKTDSKLSKKSRFTAAIYTY